MGGMEEPDGKPQRFDRRDEGEDDHERACKARDALSWTHEELFQVTDRSL